MACAIFLALLPERNPFGGCDPVVSLVPRFTTG